MITFLIGAMSSSHRTWFRSLCCQLPFAQHRDMPGDAAKPVSLTSCWQVCVARRSSLSDLVSDQNAAANDRIREDFRRGLQPQRPACSERPAGRQHVGGEWAGAAFHKRRALEQWQGALLVRQCCCTKRVSSSNSRYVCVWFIVRLMERTARFAVHAAFVCCLSAHDTTTLFAVAK